MIRGTRIEVIRRAETGKDAFNNPTYQDEIEEVDNVLVDPGMQDRGASREFNAERPNGTRTYVRFHFPKTYKHSLKGCFIRWGDRKFRVIGDPVAFPEENTPGEWNLPVDTEACDG